MTTAPNSYPTLASPVAPTAAPAARADLRRAAWRAVTWAVRIGLLAILFVIPLAAYL